MKLYLDQGNRTLAVKTDDRISLGPSQAVTVTGCFGTGFDDSRGRPRAQAEWLAPIVNCSLAAVPQSARPDRQGERGAAALGTGVTIDWCGLFF